MAQVTSATAEGPGSEKAADAPEVSVGTDAAFAPAARSVAVEHRVRVQVPG
jgi:hypothetical protein